MSRLTGKEVYSLMEAYQQVYTPQELTEEQVWEGVENWVHSLLEEGYDLSDYTWEEMYGQYLEEQGRPDSAAIRNQNVYTPPASERPQIAGGGMGGMRGSGRDRNATQTSSSPGALRVPAPTAAKIEPYKSKFAGARDAAIAKAQNIKGSPVVGPKIVGSGTPTPAAPAPGARPAAPAPGAKPDATKTLPTKPMGGDPMDQWARANPTLAAKVKPGQSGYNTIRTRLDADNDRQENYDAYDLVLSHLINEGYADTYEAALTIMTNMSEDWKYSIVEETLDERRNVTDRPLGIMHRLGRGVRTPKGEKTELMGSDREGNPTGKYLRMKHEKKAAQRENDADEQRRRDRDAMGRGTWDKD